ncbi:WYL domain-containing protein [Aeromonas hydrophila]
MVNEKVDENQKFVDRFAFIELLLMAKGWLSRADLMKRFGLKEAAATRDLSGYREVAPHNLEFNPSLKRYEIKSATFKNEYHISSSSLISKLKSRKVSSYLGFVEPPIITMRDLLPVPEKEVIMSISRAISNNLSVSFEYVSLSNGYSVKKVHPSKIFDVSGKFYLRCYDYKYEKYISLLLNRFGDFIGYHKKGDVVCDDSEWNESVLVELIPHPKLDEKDKSAICNEFCMVDGVLVKEVSVALFGFQMLKWRVDCSEKKNLDRSYLLALKNMDILEHLPHGIKIIAPGVVPRPS